MSEQRNHSTVSIRLTVLGVFVIMTGLTAAIALGLQFYFSRDLARTAAGNTFRTMSGKVGQRIMSLDDYSGNLVDMLGHFYELETLPDPGRARRFLPLLGVSMENNPSIYSAYAGYPNGEFFELINLESGEEVRHSFGAAPNDRWVVIFISGEGENRIKTSLYMDPEFRVRVQKQETSDYDPRKRPWYSASLSSARTVKTAPYFFSLLKAPGVTYARGVDGGRRVVAVDISLAGLSGFLQKQRFLPNTQAFVFDERGEIIARASQAEGGALTENKTTAIDLTDEEKAFILAHPVIKASNETDWPPFDFAMSGEPKGYSVELLNLLARKCGFTVAYVNGFSWQELTGMFQRGDVDLMHSLLKNAEREKTGVFSNPYMPMPQTFVIKRGGGPLPRSLDDLAGKVVAIPKGWATDLFLARNYPRVKRLRVATPLDALKAVSSGEAYATLDSEPVVRYLVHSYFFDDLVIGGAPDALNGGGSQGLHFMVRPEKKILAGILNKALAAVTEAEKTGLARKWFSPGDSGGDATPVSVNTVPHPQLFSLASKAGPGGELQGMTIDGREYFGYVARIKTDYGAGEYLGLLVPVAETLKPYMKKVVISFWVTLGILLILIPVVWYCATIIVNPINALALENQKVKLRRYEEVRLVQSRITEIFGLSRSIVSMASSIKAHEEAMQTLMDAFIKLIATAIDQKSPYTGGHCARVPVLSTMLAQAASNSQKQPFADFSFDSDEEWREFRTAAWLHDCGKVTMPEHIVDKATKLETIYNRIHEVRMRFEVLLRDAQIDYFRGMADGGDEDELERRRSAREKEIKDDFAFVAECNLGGEFMAPDRIERLNQIAEKTWERRLSDRLGLSSQELLRYPDKESDLPCQEPLLSDRPEHIIERPGGDSLCERNDWCHIEVPEYLYNLGEVYNLSISRGTLTAEDRYKINEHIVTTIDMLSTLPYPDNMKRIPEYAGAHHETLIGTGYPRRLSGEEIGIPGRIMAIADIFEALTASDRPYKKAKTLSESVRILSFMVKDRHLDADLFRLFLESGVYLAYAEQHLDPSQIDEVNIDEYISI